MTRSHEELYRQYCELIERTVNERLGRPLTQREKSAIWRAGSLMMLEVVDRALDAAGSADELATVLEETAKAWDKRDYRDKSQ